MAVVGFDVGYNVGLCDGLPVGFKDGTVEGLDGLNVDGFLDGFDVDGRTVGTIVGLWIAALVVRIRQIIMIKKTTTSINDSNNFMKQL
jgi:hypothetical protein